MVLDEAKFGENTRLYSPHHTCAFHTGSGGEKDRRAGTGGLRAMRRGVTLNVVEPKERPNNPWLNESTYFINCARIFTLCPCFEFFFLQYLT